MDGSNVSLGLNVALGWDVAVGAGVVGAAVGSGVGSGVGAIVGAGVGNGVGGVTGLGVGGFLGAGVGNGPCISVGGFFLEFLLALNRRCRCWNGSVAAAKPPPPSHVAIVANNKANTKTALFCLFVLLLQIFQHNTFFPLRKNYEGRALLQVL